jgi:oligopeptide transport system ATP-binding protein
MNTPSLLCVENISVIFGKGDKRVKALNNVSFCLDRGEVLGIVGESGCGKSTLARTILQLQQASDGRIAWKGQDILKQDKKQQKALRKQIQLIFQDPLDALNPRMTVAQIIAEPLYNLAPQLSRDEIQQKALTLLVSMGLQVEQQNRYPHEFSGGQCQRIGIARAMILQPELLICDEPVSALDVSIQAQIINLLMDLKEQTGMSMLFISHDLSIVRHICDRLLVLYKGEIVEIGDAESIYTNPQHAYTKKLLKAIPRVQISRQG